MADTVTEDFSGVKVVFDKPTGYTTGDPIKASITGKGVLTSVKTLTLSLQLSDPTSGATGTASGSVPFTQVSQDSVVIVSATDDQGHTYAVSADKLSVSTVA